MIIPLTPRSRPRQQVTQKRIPVRNISIIIIIRIGTVGRQQSIATQFLRFGIILVFVIIINISSVYVYVYRCKIGNKNSLHTYITCLCGVHDLPGVCMQTFVMIH